MSQKGHKRSRLPNKALAVVAALVLGGGGAALIAANASAGSNAGRNTWQQQQSPAAMTIDCPDVGDRLTDVPDQARPVVDQNLAQLDAQVADAYKRYTSGRAQADSVLSG